MLTLLLVYSAAESLLTEGNNKKKPKLCVVWTSIVEFVEYSVQQLAQIVKSKFEDTVFFVSM